MASKRTETKGDRTRAAIIAAARERFAAEGFERALGAVIAADAGVSEPTINFHFGGKAGLLVAVMEDYYDGLLTEIEAQADATEAPMARLDRFAHWWLRHSAEHWSLLAVFAHHGRRAEPDDVAVAFQRNNRRVTTVVERMLEDLKHQGKVRPDVSTKILRDAFFGTCEHVLLGWATTGRPTDMASAAEDVLDLLLNGAAGTGQAAGPGDLGAIEDKLDQIIDALDGPR